MMFWRCALLCLIACRSTRPTAVEPPIGHVGSGAVTEAQPVAKPVAVAIVFEGWEMWVGNDQLPDVREQERYPGVLRPFEAELGRLSVSDFPAGSQAAVVTYTDRATVRHPMQPIEKLGAEAFGEQKDYFGSIDRNLVAGVTAGLDELAKVKDARRVLVVISDGSDTYPTAAKGAFATLAKRAAEEHVEILTLRYLGVFSPPGSAIATLDPSAIYINSISGIVDQLGWLFARLKQPPVVAKGVAVKPVAVALLVLGAEFWMGNDDFTPAGDPARYTGALKPIRAALEQAPLTGFPPGSEAMVVTYDSSARVRVPMTAMEGLDARAIGVQRDYYGAIGTDLVSGLTQTFTELLKIEATRRVVVVIGDGADTSGEAAKTQLQALAKRAAEFHIEVYAIIYKSQLSPENSDVTVLDPNAQTVKSADEITAKLVALFATLRKQ